MIREIISMSLTPILVVRLLPQICHTYKKWDVTCLSITTLWMYAITQILFIYVSYITNSFMINIAIISVLLTQIVMLVLYYIVKFNNKKK